MIRGVRDGSRRFVGSEAIRGELVDGTSRWLTTGIVADWADWDRLHRDAGLFPPAVYRMVDCSGFTDYDNGFAGSHQYYRRSASVRTEIAALMAP